MHTESPCKKLTVAIPGNLSGFFYINWACGTEFGKHN